MRPVQPFGSSRYTAYIVQPMNQMNSVPWLTNSLYGHLYTMTGVDWLKNILGKSYIAWDFCIYNGVLENALSRRLSYMYLKVSVSLYRRQCKVAVEVYLLNAPVKRIMKLAIKRTHWLLFPAPFLIYVIPSLKARETYWQNPFLFPTGLELHADFNSALYYDSGRWRHCYPAILVLPTG